MGERGAPSVVRLSLRFLHRAGVRHPSRQVVAPNRYEGLQGPGLTSVEDSSIMSWQLKQVVGEAQKVVAGIDVI